MSVSNKTVFLSSASQDAEAGRLLDLELQLSGPSAVGSNHLVQRKVIAVLIGRRAAVFDRVETELRNPGAFPRMHTVARFVPAFDPLRGDPRFEKLLCDTLPKGAKPLDELAAKAAR